jgi:hypothetical protein
MAVLTGNDGVMYIAPLGSTGLNGVFTVNVVASLLVTRGEELIVGTSQGSGDGARVRALDTITAAATSRSCRFEVIYGGGAGYAVGNKLDFFRYVNGTKVFVTTLGAITLTEANTAAVENTVDIWEPGYQVAKIRSWTLNSASEVIETTSLGDQTKTYAPSMTSNDGSATLLFYEQDADSAYLADIYEYMDILFPVTKPREVAMSLLISRGTYTSDGSDWWKTNFAFNAFVTSASVGVAFGEVVTVDVNFTVNGPLRDRPWKGGRIF